MVQARRRPVAPDQPQRQFEEQLQSSARAAPGLAGFAVLVAVAANLGLPLPGGYLAIDMLLVAIGFDLARSADPSTRPTSDDGRWLKLYWLALVGRIGAPVALAVTLTAVYENSTAPLSEAMLRAVLGAMTMTLNLFTIFGGAELPAIEHFWVIGIIAQFALIAPILVTWGAKRIQRDQRASALVGLAVGVAICRLGFAAYQTAAYESIAINTFTRLDALLVGLAIGVAPTEALRRRFPPGAAAAAFAALLVLFLAAPVQTEQPTLSLGVLVPMCVALSAVILASTAAGNLTGAVSATLDNQVLRWLGARAVSLYLWHQIFAYALEIGLVGPTETLTDWPGFIIFVIRLTFSLAAAATSYRYLELPALAAAQRLSQRSTSPQLIEPA
ncbi:MAG: acyltransferase family protein [Acidimicrobiales bacterium]